MTGLTVVLSMADVLAITHNTAQISAQFIGIDFMYCFFLRHEICHYTLMHATLFDFFIRPFGHTKPYRIGAQSPTHYRRRHVLTI